MSRLRSVLIFSLLLNEWIVVSFQLAEYRFQPTASSVCALHTQLDPPDALYGHRNSLTHCCLSCQENCTGIGYNSWNGQCIRYGARLDDWMAQLPGPNFNCYMKMNLENPNSGVAAIKLNESRITVSSDWNGTTHGHKRFAVDGINETCFHTVVEDYPWFQVDLGIEYYVTSVLIINRQTQLMQRLHDFEIRALDYEVRMPANSSFDWSLSNGTLCAAFEGCAYNLTWLLFTCQPRPLLTRFLQVATVKYNVDKGCEQLLCFCEIKVMGRPAFLGDVLANEG